MLHYGSSSPKRHVIFSNSPHISKLSLGSLRGWKSENNKGKKPCRSYIGKDGKRKFHGPRHLKRTEKPALRWKLGLWDITMVYPLKLICSFMGWPTKALTIVITNDFKKHCNAKCRISQPVLRIGVWHLSPPGRMLGMISRSFFGTGVNMKLKIYMGDIWRSSMEDFPNST